MLSGLINLHPMNTILRTSTLLAFGLLAGCGVFQSPPQQAECPATVEAPACPVCPEEVAEPLTCPEPQVVEKVVTVPAPAPPPPPTTATQKNLPIVGAVEWATVEPANIRMEARIDTGSATTTLHAEDLQLVEKDGKRWVHFSLLDPATDEKIAVEARLRRKVVKKSSDGDKQTRYVVKLWIGLGDSRILADVTLSERDMEYPLIVGRNVLVDTMIVDVSRKHLVSN
jgi:hypothetical protein